MFRVGQKVVCVDDAKDRSDVNYDPWGCKGRVYVISKVGMFSSPAYEPTLCVWVDGIYRPDWRGIDVPFRASRFRPVVTRKTDISVFRALINPVKEEA